MNNQELNWFQIFDSSLQGMCIIDVNYNIIEVNRTFALMFGIDKKEIVGKKCFDIYGGSFCNTAKCLLMRIIKGEQKSLLERDLCNYTGKQMPCIVTARPYYSCSGEMIGMIQEVTDTTTLRRFEIDLKRTSEQYRMIFDNSPLGIIHFDQTGMITHSNEKFIEILESTREKIIGFNMLTQLQDVKMIASLRTALKNKVSHYEGIYTSVTSGKKLPLKAVFRCILSEDNEFFGGIGIFEDITQKVEIEKEMARLDSLYLVGQMAGGIGHEVRNPMTSVRGFLQLLANKETDANKMEYYDIMIQELDRANSIISEFLSLAKDRVVEFRPASLNVIINTLYPLLSSDAIKENKRIVLNKGEVPNISLNEKEIRQLIINLVKNAIEASPTMGVITISTYVSQGEVVLCIEDEGTGIPPEIYDKLGTPFVTTKDSGTGLGLSVCYSIAHKHNAKIDVKTGSSGTTFYVRFKMPQTQIAKQVS